jgi:integrase
MPASTPTAPTTSNRPSRRWKDADGRPHRRTVHGDIHAARDELAAARTKRARHEREPADARTTLVGVIDRYREDILPGLRPRSRRVYSAALTRAASHFDTKRISAISRTDIRSWVNSMIGGGLKANTTCKYYEVLRAVYTFARDDLHMPVTFPALRQRDLPDPADDQRPKRILTDKEVQKILAKLAPREALYFRQLAETGMRASEGLAVAPEAIDAIMLAIHHQRGLDGKRAPLKSKHSHRDIEITKSLAAELKLAGGFSDLTYQTARRAWNDAVEASGIDLPHPKIHDLGHTHASKLIALGWDVVEIAKRLGDREATIWRVYAHEFDKRRRSAQRQAALESAYAGMATGMATSTPAQAITDEAKVQHLRAPQ